MSFIHAYSCICCFQLKQILLFCHGLRIAVNSFAIFLSELMIKTARLPRPCVETIVYGDKIYALLTKRWVKMARYWPILFSVFIDRDEVDINTYNRSKNEANTLDSHLDRKRWVNKEFTILPKRELFCGTNA